MDTKTILLACADLAQNLADGKVDRGDLGPVIDPIRELLKEYAGQLIDTLGTEKLAQVALGLRIIAEQL